MINDVCDTSPRGSGGGVGEGSEVGEEDRSSSALFYDDTAVAVPGMIVRFGVAASLFVSGHELKGRGRLIFSGSYMIIVRA